MSADSTVEPGACTLPAEARPRLMDWVVTPPFLIAFGLILAFFDPVQRVVRLFGSRPHDWVAAALQWSIVAALRLCGVKLEVERDPQVVGHRPYVVVANHQSMFDIAFLGGVLFTNFPKYVSKKDLAYGIPSISFNIRRGGSAIIDRDRRDQAVDEIRRLGERVRARGVSAVIFPEGTRARDGMLRDFRPAGTLALMDAAFDVPLVPVAIDGSWRLMRRNLWPLPFGACVKLKVGPPFPRAAGEDRALLMAQAEAWIQRTIAGWRGQALTAPAAAPDTMVR